MPFKNPKPQTPEFPQTDTINLIAPENPKPLSPIDPFKGILQNPIDPFKGTPENPWNSEVDGKDDKNLRKS